ncbi:hypothetical protein BJ508DRAFT_411189 [Ascobolus immersus RN42]|uniref:Uncharacterized protein n=1 Tax=Ascobolus immersus RN42 TaxID=1160509 RepID=A0A3N4IP43_ASCIM|nr:hypothetical protein BJ508DRAFT_411189 [Ascobolus immersus RN42]
MPHPHLPTTKPPPSDAPVQPPLTNPPPNIPYRYAHHPNQFLTLKQLEQLERNAFKQTIPTMPPTQLLSMFRPIAQLPSRSLHTSTALLSAKKQGGPTLGNYRRAEVPSDGEVSDQPSTVDKVRDGGSGMDPQAESAKQGMQEHDRAQSKNQHSTKKGAPDHALGMEDQIGSVGEARKSEGEGMKGSRKAPEDPDRAPTVN